jgi:tyrosyl-tRNA synthetase
LNAELTSPWSFWQYWLNLRDEEVAVLLPRLSMQPLSAIEETLRRHLLNPGPRIAQRMLADEMTEWVHGGNILATIHAASEILFGAEPINLADQALLGLLRRELPTTELAIADLNDLDIAEVSIRAGVTSSRAEARRLISNGGLAINGVRVADPSLSAKAAFAAGAGLIQKGKKTHHLILVE